jgi:hypothetical protein
MQSSRSLGNYRREGQPWLHVAVARLHEAQLAALECHPKLFHEAHLAQRELLETVGEIGYLLVRLARGGAAAVELRGRLVKVGAACCNTLAQLVGLVYDLDEGEESAAPVAGGELLAVTPAARSVGASNRGRGLGEVTAVRAVTDLNRLLVAQLKRALDGVQQSAGWRPATPGELWLELVVQVAALFPLLAALEASNLSGAEAHELNRLTAEAANHIAFLRFYPRLPTL